MTAVLGRKVGMTQIFGQAGRIIPVTVVEVRPGAVVEVKTNEKHGYEAVKVGFFEEKKERKLTKPAAGVFKKAGTALYRALREFPISGLKVGGEVKAESFTKGDVVCVTGGSNGKGFQGVMKRHKFSGGPGSHGSMFNRAPGSIGASSYPSRVWKGQKMAGHMGARRVTTQGIEVVDVRENLLLLRGAVPGAKNSVVEVRKA